jgi:hypothetical protein
LKNFNHVIHPVADLAEAEPKHSDPGKRSNGKGFRVTEPTTDRKSNGAWQRRIFLKKFL